MTTQNWKLDTAHSEIGFTVTHMMFAKVRGIFGEWTGEFRYDSDNPADSYVRAQIASASISTNNEKRDGHLRSADFFDAETYPNLTFESTKWREVSGGYEVVGDLTIRDTTKQVTLTINKNGVGVDPWGNNRIGLSGSTTINREQFGLTWNQALEAGGVLVGNEVSVNLEVQATAVEHAEAAAE